MSVCATAIVAAKSAVAAPTTAMIVGTQSSAWARIGLTRTMRYTPAVTIVAAWMRADTGVGPAIASGSHTYSGSCADLPAAPRNSSAAIAVAVTAASSGARSRMPFSPEYWSVPSAENARKIASMKPQSPTRLVTNAFFPAAAFASFVNQNEMRK